MRSRNILLLCAIVAILTGCGAGTPDAPASTVPSLAITLTNGGVPVTSITSGTPATVKATLKDASGAAVAGAVVTFSTDQALATITPAATALTDTAGVATVTLSPATVNASGAATITATSQIGTTALTGTIGFSVGGAVVTLTNLVFGANPLTAFGTTSVAVTVSVDGVPVTTPQTVTFSSPCASSGKAELSTGISTINGIATATYRDKGCTGTDIITATVSGLASTSATLNITQLGLAITLTNGGVPVTSITSGAPATVKATLKDTSGAAIAGAIVTFSTDPTLATITPSATALTDSAGIATVTLSPASLSAIGATYITTTSQVGASTLTSTINYSVGSAAVALTNPAFGINPLPALVTTSVAVTVSVGGVTVTTPQTVTFSSPCISSGKAVLANAVTVNGIATSTYTDKGCGGPDTITASVSGLASSSATLSITQPSLVVALTNGGVPVTSITSGAPATVKATLKDANGTAIVGAVVTFTTDTTLATITPSKTAITDSAGVATVTLSPASLTAVGAATITATSQVGASPLIGAVGYSVGDAVVTVTNPVFGINPLPAFGATSVAVTVSVGGVPVATPQTVAFSSPCISSGKAVLANAVTVNGIATGTYTDKGCGGPDTITASVSGLASSSATLNITQPSLVVTLTNAGGVPVTSITSGAPTTVKATLKDATGTAIVGAVVTFTTDTTLAAITPSATALTDSAGVATVTLSPATVTAVGAATITATSQVGMTALTGTINFSVGGAVVTITNPNFGANPLPAFGTTSVAVTVSVGGAPVATAQTVAFSSPCISSSKAVLANAVTVNGIATSTYTDKGCGGPDTITASVSGLASSSATLNITQPSLVVTLTNTGGVPVTSITSGAPATVKATLKDGSGVAVAGEIVTFSTDSALATITPSATALTDSAGVATVTLSPATLAASGATTITATGQAGGRALTGTIGYSVGSAVVTISAPTFGINPLSAFGTTSVSVTVSSGGAPVATPQTVTFSSLCINTGKAELASAVTVNGIATGNYIDKGCGAPEMITASVSGLASSSAMLTITAPATGSIQYVSATPASISLKGTGGNETAQVTFKVLDTSGNPLSGKSVTFGLSTTVGGITISDVSKTTDVNGLVMTTVNAGTMNTPVRVAASTCSNSTSPCTGTTLATQSSQLTITTGIPVQNNFSLSVTKFNIESWNMDGETTVLTARLADHFGNPAPDGTAVNFTTEGGSVTPSCVTTAGACSATWTSQALRPDNGRVTVLAYAVGEEGFTDLNGNGLADYLTEMKDANGLSTDMGEAYVDYNENGVRDAATEPFIDFNQNGAYNGTTTGAGGVGGTATGDSQYNGVLCDSANLATTCSTLKNTHVRGSAVIVFSSSDANVTINGGLPINLPPCSTVTGSGAPLPFTVTVVDQNGNAMPAGTTVDFTTSNGTITSSASYIVPNSIGCRTVYPGCPASAGSATFGDIQVTMLSDAAFAVGTPPAPNTCTNSTPNGSFTVTVTAPGGTKTYATATVTD